MTITSMRRHTTRIFALAAGLLLALFVVGCTRTMSTPSAGGLDAAVSEGPGFAGDAVPYEQCAPDCGGLNGDDLLHICPDPGVPECDVKLVDGSTVDGLVVDPRGERIEQVIAAHGGRVVDGPHGGLWHVRFDAAGVDGLLAVREALRAEGYDAYLNAVGGPDPAGPEVVIPQDSALGGGQ